MTKLVARVNADEWLVRIFASRAAAEGAIVRRAVRDVDRIVGRRRFLYEVERRGFQAVENAGQIVIFCNREPVRALTLRSCDPNSEVPQIP